MSAQIRNFDPWESLVLSEAYSLAEGRKGPRSGKKASRDGKDRGPKTSDSKKVLVFGRLFELALYRAEVLRNRGFSVVTPKTKAEAIAAIDIEEFDAVVLSYTLSSDTAEELIELARQKCPGCPLITISDTGSADRRLHPDVVVRAGEGPAGLIKALQRVFRTQ